MKAYGTVHKYGDNVDTDVIIPARYLNSSDPAELATHCMEDIDKEFVKQRKSRRYYRGREELWLWFLQRACTDCYQGGRCKLRHRGDICQNFLPQLRSISDFRSLNARKRSENIESRR